MNSLCPPLLRNAGRLDILEIEPSRTVHKKQPPIPARVVRRALERCELRHRHTVLQQLEERWLCLAHARRDAQSLSALLGIMALAAPAESRGPCDAPRFGGDCDMRPWISDREVLRGWICEMRQYWPQAVMPLVKQRLLPAWALDMVPAQDRSFCLDVFVAARFGERVDMGTSAFGQRFAWDVLPFVPYRLTLADVRRLETSHSALPVDLQESADICALLRGGHAGAEWLSLISKQTPERARWLLNVLLSEEMGTVVPPKGTAGLLLTLRHASARRDPKRMLQWAIRGLRKGADPGWLAGTVRLSWYTNLDPPHPVVSPLRPSALRIEAFINVWSVRLCSTWYLWRAASRHEGFVGVLSQISKANWCEKTAEALITWLECFGEKEENVSYKGRWEQLCRHWQDVLHLLHQADGDERSALAGFLRDAFHDERAEKDAALGADALQWARILHETRLIPDDNHVHTLVLMHSCFNSAQRRTLARHLPSLVGALNKVGNIWSIAEKIRRGMACMPVMRKEACLFLLVREPRLFLKGLALLGKLGDEAALRVARAFAEHPMAACDAEQTPLRHLAVMVEATSVGRVRGMAVKERLRAYLAGEKTLPPHLLESDRQDLLQAWARLAVEVLEDLVIRELRVMFPGLRRSMVQDGTLLFLHTLNSRETRRKESDLLRSLAGYQAQPKFTHLANVRWIRKLPADTAAQWITGITLTGELPKLGNLTLAIEQDAAEVLHMGDYGYSCLGTGSCNQYSALTNAMEANKHVVYARNNSGRVVGRQLLVISEEMKLVCFCVYPLNASEELRGLFGDFDCAFAEALKLPVETGDDYTVAAPLGLGWYDDGSWDPTPDTAE